MSARPHASSRLDRLAQSWHVAPLVADARAEPDDGTFADSDTRSGGDGLPPLAADRAVAFAADPGSLSWRDRVNVGLEGRARRAVIALVAVVLGAAGFMWWTGRPVETTPLPVSPAAAGQPAAAGSATAEVVVHVVGAVREPGLVRLPVGARVADAVEAAGGATRQRALSSVNLARVLVDGEQIVVGQSAASAAGAGKVSLSTADVAALEALPGIGPALAARIVAWRDAHGPFTSVDALDEVSGIGPTVLANLRDLAVP